MRISPRSSAAIVSSVALTERPPGSPPPARTPPAWARARSGCSPRRSRRDTTPGATTTPRRSSRSAQASEVSPSGTSTQRYMVAAPAATRQPLRASTGRRTSRLRRYASRVRSTCASSLQATTDARWTNSCGAAPVEGRYVLSAETISGGPATKPERYPVIDERFESVWKTTTFDRSRELEGRARRLVEPELAVGLVRAEHEVVLAARARPAARRTRAGRSRRSGCSGSSPRRARSGPSRPRRRGPGGSRSVSSSGSVSTRAPANAAPRAGTG